MARNPFDELSALFERMSEQFEDTAETWPRGFSDWTMTAAPSLDLVEHDDEYLVTVDLPGYEKGDVTVRVTDHTLYIDAERDTADEQEDDHYLRRERSHRSARRQVKLPDVVDPDAVTATMKHGVLTVTVPKAEPASTGHRIAVE